MKKQIFKIIPFFLLCVSFLAGCAPPEEHETKKEQETKTFTEPETDPDDLSEEEIFMPQIPKHTPDEIPFNGVQIDENGRLAVSAYHKVHTFETGKEPVKALYVGIDGSDGNDGSYLSPFASIGRALRDVEPGTSILIKPGNYRGMSIYEDNLRGTEDAPIWIGGIPGAERPVFDMGGGEAAFAIISGSSYIVLHDMEIKSITGATGTGINIFCTTPAGGEWREDAHHFVYRNLYMHDISYQHIKMAGVKNYWIFDCELSEDTNGGSAIIDGVGIHEGVIAYNYIHTLSRHGGGRNGQLGIQLKGASSQSDIYGNIFKETGLQAINIGQVTGVQFFRPALKEGVYEGTDIRVYSNIFTDCHSPAAFWSSTDCYFVNNTVISPFNSFFRLLPSDDSIGLANGGVSHNNTVANNIFYGRPVEPFNVSSGNIGTQTLTVKNNIFNPASKPAASIFPLASDNISKNPLFADIASGDYAPAEGSPAVGAGLHFDFAAEDFFGKPFPVTPNIGAVQ